MTGEMFWISLVISMGMVLGALSSFEDEIDSEVDGRAVKQVGNSSLCQPDLSTLTFKQTVEVLSLQIAYLQEVEEYNKKTNQTSTPIPDQQKEGMRIILKYFKEAQRYNIYSAECERFINCIEDAFNHNSLPVLQCDSGDQNYNRSRLAENGTVYNFTLLLTTLVSSPNY